MATAYHLSELLLDRFTDTPGIAVYDAIIPDNPPATGWIVIYPSPGQEITTRLGSIADTLDWDALIVCCGRSRAQCLNTVSIVRDQLRGLRLDDTRSASPLHEDVTGPILPDLTIPTEPRFSITLRYNTDTLRS